MRCLIILLSVCSSPGLPFSVVAQDNRLTIERIFSSADLQPDTYSVNWMPQGGSYYVLEKAADGNGHDIVLVNPITGLRETLIAARQLVPREGTEPIEVGSFQISPDGNRILIFNNTQRVWRYPTRGDYWVVDRTGEHPKKLGGSDSPESSLMFAKFSPDSLAVAWVRDRNVYVESLADGQITQVTTTDSDDIINGTSDWVYEEELDLRDGFRWSDDGNRIVFWRFDTSQVGEFTMINNTDQLYPVLTKFHYPKAGTTNSAVSIGIHDLNEQTTRYVDLPGDPREHYPARIDWIPGSQEFLLQRLNRLQNRNDIYAVNAATGETRLVWSDSSDSWVEVCDNIQWWPDQRHFSFVSERDGWQHLYRIDVTSGERQLLTPGEFDVVELYRIDPDTGECFFLASPDDPKCRYLYRQAFGESGPERLTPADQPGWHEYSFSADGSGAVHHWSRFDVPSRFETVRLPDHTTIDVHCDNRELMESLDDLPECDHEFFRVNIEDDGGTSLSIDAWAMKPPGFDTSRKYPAIVYVYGEPWGTTVTDRWDSRNGLWHRLLCQHGYVVLSFDNRGAKVPRGAAWRKAIYRLIGTVNAQDQANALRATLEKFDWIDRERVGIWGWSGGGSSTLHAMFKYPELYHTGISVAPVPDQRYYDTIYQERYMQTPDLNPQGFHDGSPVNFAGNLQGDLLLIHGTGDDNCHYQTMELLINRLIANDKPFSMMAYPNRSHGIYEYENTTLHLRKLMTRYFLEHLPAGPAAPEDHPDGFQIDSPENRRLAEVLPKQIDVFGIKVLATRLTPDDKVVHAATVLAEYLDNDEDGVVDNQEVVDELIRHQANMVMAADRREFERLEDRLHDDLLESRGLQGLWGEETRPGGAERGEFDATLEEVLHLVTHFGYSRVYPDVFGERPGTRIANAMDAARGGTFERVPRSYPLGAWYTCDDGTCKYGCQVTEYFYWGLTSKLGGQQFPGRLQEIGHEWRLNTPQKLREGDPVLFELLDDPQYRLPRRLPDGQYRRNK